MISHGLLRSKLEMHMMFENTPWKSLVLLSSNWVLIRAIPENIHTPLWTTRNWVLKNFRISKKENCSFCKIPEAADSKS